MVKKGVIFHNICHVILPLLILLVFIRITPEINILKFFIVILIGSFFPDIDHIVLWRKYESFGEFLRYCLSSDRYRKSSLVFHNILTILIVIVCVAMFSMINILMGTFFLAMLAHLVLDFLTDWTLIKSHGHWKLKSWI